MPRFIKQFGLPRSETPQPNRFKDFWLPLAPTVVAITAILSQVLIHAQNLRFQQYQLTQVQADTQRKLKEYELSFKPKQEAYVAFMKAFDALCESQKESEESRSKAMDNLRKTFYGVEPFLDAASRSNAIAAMLEAQKTQFINCKITQRTLYSDLSNALFAAREP